MFQASVFQASDFQASDFQAGVWADPRSMSASMSIPSNDLMRDRPWSSSPDRLSVWVQLYVVLAFLMTSSSFYAVFADPATVTNTTSRASNNPTYMLLWLTLYAATGVMFMLSLTRGLHSSLLTALPTIALAVASTIWSVTPLSTLFYSCMLTANIMIGYVLARHAPPAAMLDLIGRTLCVLLVTSLLLFMFAPKLAATERFGGGWIGSMEMYGVFAHKSDAGYYLATLILILVIAPFRAMGSILRAVLIGLAFFGILLSNSATALVGALGCSASVYALARAGRWQGRLTAGATALLVMLSVLLPYLEPFGVGAAAEAVGRDPQLTGRGPIWESARTFIAERPFFGFGYMGFFDNGPYSPAQRVWLYFEWFKTPNFHNSALEYTIYLGVTGLFVYLLSLAGAFAVAWNGTIAPQIRMLMWALLMLFVLSATIDVTLMRHNHFSTAFMFYCLFCAQTRYDERTGQPA